jgi:capsular polysaccharide transport system permease protein
MIKKLLMLFWFEKKSLTSNVKAFKNAQKNYHDSSKLEVIKENRHLYVTYTKRYEKIRLRFLFISLFLVSLAYILFVKTELYQSQTSIIVKDMNAKAPSLDLNILGTGVSSQTQDAKIIEAYLKSEDIYILLDKEFRLTEHYKSDVLDIVSRLNSDASKEEVIQRYQDRLEIVYDEVSGILELTFLHSDAQTAQKVLQFLVNDAESKLNLYNHRNANKQLAFINKTTTENLTLLDNSIAILEAYQNENKIIDPLSEIKIKSAIIANLEAMLIEKKATKNQLENYMSSDKFEVVSLKNEIKEIEKTVEQTKASLSGENQERLNKTLFEFERLKAEVEFTKEVYKQSLLQLEMAKIDVNKEAKSLIVLTVPNLADGYTKPNKVKDTITLIILFLLAYGITSLLGAIIKDHKD